MKILLGAIALVAALMGAAGAGAQTTSVVMSGLDSPRGLAFGPEGALYVAEAGRGGPGPCVLLPPPRLLQCYGPTGAVSRLWRGEQERIATGLPSYGSALETTGPHDISLLGRGGAYLTIGLGLELLPRSALGSAGDQFGQLVHVPASGRWRPIADIAAYEIANNPDGGDRNSNPYGLLAEPGSRVVVDAGGNTLLRVRANGDISTVAVFGARANPSPIGPPFSESVPTAVAVGPDGAYYVAELTGVPFLAGFARIHRVAPDGTTSVYASGFTTVIDIAFGPDGSLYVLEHSTGPVFFAMPGRLLKVATDGTRTTVIDGLTRPGSVAVGPDGALYVSNRSISIGLGEVLRIEP
jgi:hypothetical protein